jgi:uncharacterized iron-regulated membrane protein
MSTANIIAGSLSVASSGSLIFRTVTALDGTADAPLTAAQVLGGFFTVTPTADRTVHIDQYMGNILADVTYADYPVLGKAMAVGIALHEGQLGWWNVALNALFCLSVVTLCVTGVVMWWKRRPAGEVGAPRYPRDYRKPARWLHPVDGRHASHGYFTNHY